jgi:hypothetical protein
MIAATQRRDFAAHARTESEAINISRTTPRFRRPAHKNNDKAKELKETQKMEV